MRKTVFSSKKKEVIFAKNFFIIVNWILHKGNKRYSKNWKNVGCVNTLFSDLCFAFFAGFSVLFFPQIFLFLVALASRTSTKIANGSCFPPTVYLSFSLCAGCPGQSRAVQSRAQHVPDVSSCYPVLICSGTDEQRFSTSERRWT